MYTLPTDATPIEENEVPNGLRALASRNADRTEGGKYIVTELHDGNYYRASVFPGPERYDVKIELVTPCGSVLTTIEATYTDNKSK